MSVFCGCGDSKSKSKDKDKKASSTDSKFTPKEKDDSSVAETKPIEEDWSAFNFTIDGKVMKLPIKYSDFKLTGWEVDLNNLGYANNYIDPRLIIAIAPAFHSKYRTLDNKDDISCGLDLRNHDSEAQYVTKCDVIGFEMDIRKAIEDKKTYPKVVLSKGITWGATKEDVEKAFGKPQDTIRIDELKLWAYYYDTEHRHMSFDIYDDIGLSSILLRDYTK